MRSAPDRATIVGIGVVAVAAMLYWLANRQFDAGRGDFFYLADAFLHGRAAIDVQLGPNDVIPVGGRFYVPFAPFRQLFPRCAAVVHHGGVGTVAKALAAGVPVLPGVVVTARDWERDHRVFDHILRSRVSYLNSRGSDPADRGQGARRPAA